MWTILMPLLLVTANVLGAGMIVPQVLRFRRHRSADGVSGAWVGIGVTMNAWWLAYALDGRLWGLVPVSAVALVLYCVIGLQYHALAGPVAVRQIGRGALVIGTIPLVCLLWGGWPAAGLAIGLVYAVQFSPATLAALRATDLTGISPATWTMACIEACIWLVYGLVEGDLALVVGGSGGAVLSAVVLVCLARRRPPVERVGHLEPAIAD